MRRQRLPFPQDPRWITARFPSRCDGCHQPMQAGDQIFYYPNSKTVFCNREDCGKRESRHLEAAIFDERMYAL